MVGNGDDEKTMGGSNLTGTIVGGTKERVTGTAERPHTSFSQCPEESYKAAFNKVRGSLLFWYHVRGCS